jgi:mitochondrial intermembrane space import and assembly protein 40
MQTVDAVVEEKRKQAEIRAKAVKKEQPEAESAQMTTTTGLAEGENETAAQEDEEAGSDKQAAFNPETGEINWDCPCLGGMAHGPCGEEFKAAFSCFVYSEEEPKGMDCIEKFQYGSLYGMKV